MRAVLLLAAAGLLAGSVACEAPRLTFPDVSPVALRGDEKVHANAVAHFVSRRLRLGISGIRASVKTMTLGRRVCCRGLQPNGTQARASAARSADTCPGVASGDEPPASRLKASPDLRSWETAIREPGLLEHIIAA